MKNLLLKAIFGSFSSKIAIGCIFVFSINIYVNAQCPVTAFVNPQNVLCGSTVSLSAVAAGCQPLKNDFNGGDMTMGGTQPWQSSNGATVQNGTGAHACVGPPSEGAFSLWMGTTVAAPRSITSNAYDMTQCAAVSGSICFDMKYGTQAGPSPCEGIDLPAEGVSIQYNTGGGWITLQYWDPNGGNDANLTSWRTYCITLPPAALTPATQFRWFQSQSSGAGFDAWGLDNIVINLNAPGYTFDWAHDAQAPSASPATPNVVVTANTTYTVTYTNGVETCSDNVSVTVISPTATATASPTTICAGSATPVQLNAISSISYTAPTSCGLSADATCTQFATIADEQQVGAGATTHTYNNGNEDVLGDFGDAYMTTQILFRAADLTAAGIVAGKITSLSLDVQRIETSGGGTISSVVYPNVKIHMGCTALNVMTATYVGGLSQVYSGSNVSISTGWSPFFFNQGYEWDGVSNVIVQVCFYWANGASSQASVATGGTANYYAFLRYNSPGYNCSVNVESSNFSIGTCGTDPTFATLYSYRPNVKFGFCKPSNLPLTYSWTSAPASLNSAIRNPTHAPASSTTYTVSVNQTGMPAACAVTSNVAVSVINGPTVTINPNPTQICNPATTANLSGVAVAVNSAIVPKTFTATGAAVPEGATSCGGAGTLNSPLTVGGASPLTLATNPIQSVVINMNPVTDIGDYDFILVAPTGTTYPLVNFNTARNGAGPQVFTLATGGAAFPATPAGLNGGTYAPATAFPVTGNVNGIWTLRVIDHCKPTALTSSTGTLVSWSITFNAPNNITSFSWTPTTNLVGSTTNAFVVTNTAVNRTYTLTATDANGCTGQASVPVSIGCTLPVELIDFNLSCENDKIDLKWDVASQQNNDFFTIERSSDGISFMEIGKIDGDGSSILMKSFSFEDQRDYKTASTVYPIYYRLSQTDFNGLKETIALKAVNDCNSKTNNVCITTYPNPVENHRVAVSTTEIKNKSFDLLLHDMFGRLVYSSTIIPESDNYTVMVELPESIQRGIYLISSKGANEIKFCEQKIAIQ